MKKLRHLVKRFVTSLDRRALSNLDIETARGVLTDREFELWSRMPLIDQKHSLVVLRRFLNILPEANKSTIRACLLHDLGKTEAQLGVFGRVIATVVGRRGQRFIRYHDHEAIGAKMLRDIGSEEATWRLVSGEIPKDDAQMLKFARAMLEADEI